jgi:hypothetical protein
MTARGSSALFDARSAAVDSDAAGAAGSTGLTGATVTSERVSALAAAGGLTGANGAAVGAGLTADPPRISATRVHAAVAVSNPARRTPIMTRFVLTEIMVDTSVRSAPLEISGPPTGEAVVAVYRNSPRAVKHLSRRAVTKLPPLRQRRRSLWLIMTARTYAVELYAPPTQDPVQSASVRLPALRFTSWSMPNARGNISRPGMEPAWRVAAVGSRSASCLVHSALSSRLLSRRMNQPLNGKPSTPVT